MQKQGLQATGILANVCKRAGIASASALLSGGSATLLEAAGSGASAAAEAAAGAAAAPCPAEAPAGAASCSGLRADIDLSSGECLGCSG